MSILTGNINRMTQNFIHKLINESTEKIDINVKLTIKPCMKLQYNSYKNRLNNREVQDKMYQEKHR